MQGDQDRYLKRFCDQTTSGFLDGSLQVPNEASPDDQCTICLSDSMETPVTLTKCKHSFCATCVIDWQRKNKDLGCQSECPVCRTKTTEEVEVIIRDRVKSMSEMAIDRTDITEEERSKVFEYCLAYLDAIIQSDGEHLGTRVVKARILYWKGDYQNALDTIELVLEKNKKFRSRQQINHPEEMEAVDRFWDLMDPEESASPALHDEASMVLELMAKALIENRNGNVDQSMSPQGVIWVHILRCQIYMAMENWAKALEHSEYTHRMMASVRVPNDETSYDFFVDYSECAYHAKEYRKSIIAADHAIALCRYKEPVYRFKALSQQHLGQLDDAVGTMNLAVLYETPWDRDNIEMNLELYKELLTERDGGTI